MRLANMAYEELTEAMNRGWGTRNSNVGQLLQVERAGIPSLNADPKRIATVFDVDKQKQVRESPAFADQRTPCPDWERLDPRASNRTPTF